MAEAKQAKRQTRLDRDMEDYEQEQKVLAQLEEMKSEFRKEEEAKNPKKKQ